MAELLRVSDIRKRLRLELTPGERLLVARRRSGLSQIEMAEIYGVGLDKYRGWEENLGDVPHVKGVHVRELPLEELCFLHRRRRGITLKQVATAFGKSPSWAHGVARRGRSENLRKIVDYLLGWMPVDDGDDDD